ncbi:hypothetical protein TRP8649_04317 [Pelagimonas phthalicica]|uniref:Uncharacterized protein n=1 Tax=Pelagimonas phthalicica TaxID=1037362 RepID=A0A238JIB3_9RHOB|nr:hypothetical protein [Pelagimonas phthalicica]TDS90008.1 hypothetical protein CLV87_4063 [Pelagimonas phthalicica]SMX30175.1 hypothetical protein TRP8649_04317 [Pelagimonas phthalicica]
MMRATPILAALSVSLFGVMLWLVHSVLKPAAQGLAPFDERGLGYSLDDAQTYLSTLDSTGKALYLVELRLLDSAFPVVLALLLGHLIMNQAANMHPWSRLVLVIPAAGYAMMDLCENALVAGLLRAGADGITPEMVARASQFTVSKWVLLLISLGLLLVLSMLRMRQEKGRD